MRINENFGKPKSVLDETNFRFYIERGMMIRKKQLGDVDRSMLVEPELTGEEEGFLAQGVRLFNDGRFWEAHEAWEQLWRRRTEESRIFFQGIIQAAAGFHRIVEKPLLRGAVNNLDKASAKLAIFPPVFLGVDVENLRQKIAEARATLETHGLPSNGEGTGRFRPVLLFRRNGVY